MPNCKFRAALPTKSISSCIFQEAISNEKFGVTQAAADQQNQPVSGGGVEPFRSTVPAGKSIAEPGEEELKVAQDARTQERAEIIKAPVATHQPILASEKKPDPNADFPERFRKGRFCHQVIDEVKRIRNLVHGTGRTMAEIQTENPRFVVWKVADHLGPEDREVFYHPWQWGAPVGYAKLILSKECGCSVHNIDRLVKAYRKYKRQAK